MALRYKTLHTKALPLELANNEGLPKHYSNFLDGSQYLEAVDEGPIKEDDIVLISVAVTRAGVFANLWNKIGKILKIFERLDYLRSWWVLCQL
jgi:hypothetical protein